MTSSTPHFTSLCFRQYWGTYFPDLIRPLSERHRRIVLENLFDGFIDGIYAGRATVQRLIEVHSGVITHEQYVSWSMSSEHDDGTEHVLAHLARGEYVGGSRVSVLELLGHVDYTSHFAERMRWAVRRGLLSEWEADRVIATSLRTAPLPRLVDRPEGVPALPFTRVHHEHAHEHEEQLAAAG